MQIRRFLWGTRSFGLTECTIYASQFYVPSDNQSQLLSMRRNDSRTPEVAQWLQQILLRMDVS